MPIAHVAFRPIPEAGTRVAALRTGAADVITNVPFQYATLLAGGTSTRMASARSVRVLYVAFNTLKPGPQQNVLVRQALNYALDVPAIIKSVLGGRAYELGQPVPPNFFGYDPALAPYRHDPAKAKALLAKAGYPEGKGLELTLYAPQGRYNGDKEVALAIGGQLQAFGVHVDVRTQEWVSYFRQALQRGLTPMYMLGWGNITYDADNTLSSQLVGDATTSTYANPRSTSWSTRRATSSTPASAKRSTPGRCGSSTTTRPGSSSSSTRTSTPRRSGCSGSRGPTRRSTSRRCGCPMSRPTRAVARSTRAMIATPHAPGDRRRRRRAAPRRQRRRRGDRGQRRADRDLPGELRHRRRRVLDRARPDARARPRLVQRQRPHPARRGARPLPGGTLPTRGALTVTVPGAVRSWEDVGRAHGRRGLDELLIRPSATRARASR